MPKIKSVEHRIADAILDDIMGRSGFRQLFEEIDEEIRWEMQSDWLLIILKELSRTTENGGNHELR